MTIKFNQTYSPSPDAHHIRSPHDWDCDPDRDVCGSPSTTLNRREDRDFVPIAAERTIRLGSLS